MLLLEQRQQVVDHARRCQAEGLIVGTAGNLSIAVGDNVAMTPSGVDYAELTAEDVVVVDRAGELVEGNLLPSSEWQLHLAIYEAHGPSAVVHTHSPYATAVSTLVDELPAMHYHISLLGGPVPVAPYATFGSRELAESVTTALADRKGTLMQNHGAVTVGSSLADAFKLSQSLEWLAQIFCIGHSVGSPRLLSDEDIEDVKRAGAALRARRSVMPGWR